MTDAMTGAALSCPLPAKGDRFKMPGSPQWPKLRIGTQLDAIYERLATRGHGFSKPGMPAGRPRVIVVFDTRCAWSNNFWKTSKILEDDVDFVWYPVGVSQDYSTAQAAALLASNAPWELLNEHEERFSDPDFSGIRAEDYGPRQSDRDRVWENARIYRKAGGTQVPLAIAMTPGGPVPFFGDSTAGEIRAALGL
ncbi:MAG: hypothetical protein HUK26_07960 [Duodenibacillus sp.]|nr:hypothetical protein [Duodenibacillus sp.]